MRFASIVLVLVFSIESVGCLTQASGPARAQEASNEFNVHTRFGRMELAAEKVAPEARELIAKHRSGWGSRVRIADLESAGLRMTNDAKSEAEVSVRIAWFRPNEGELRVTTLKQKWKDFRGDWRIVSEDRADGELGLLGEAVQRVDVSAQERKPHQFPTVHLSGAAQND
jgi:hypothetical protein